jgi:hypothetical protein
MSAAISVREPVLKNIKPETRAAIDLLFESLSDLPGYILSKCLNEFTDIQDVQIFIKLGVVWKDFNEVFWKSRDVVFHLYVAYFERTGVPLNPSKEPFYRPNFKKSINSGFPCSGWRLNDAMPTHDKKYFFDMAKKTMVLAFTPWCSSCKEPISIGFTKSVPIWYERKRLCIPCLKKNLISDRELLQEHGWSIMTSIYNQKRKAIEAFQENSGNFFVMNSSPENLDLMELTDNPINFVSDPDPPKRYQRSFVFLFWIPDINRMISTEKIIFRGQMKKNAVALIGAYLRMSNYRKIVAGTLKTAPLKSAAEVIPPPPAKLPRVQEPLVYIKFLNMDKSQRKCVLEKIDTMVKHFQFHPDPSQVFISHFIKKEKAASHAKMMRTIAQTPDAKFYNWDIENIKALW